MAKYDEIYQSFLEHDIFTDKYELDINELPKKVIGMPTNIKIIDTLRLLVDKVERDKGKTNKEIISIITKSLN